MRKSLCSHMHGKMTFESFAMTIRELHTIRHSECMLRYYSLIEHYEIVKKQTLLIGPSIKALRFSDFDDSNGFAGAVPSSN